MDILADSPLIPASFFLDSMSSTHPPPKAGSFTLCHSGLCLEVYSYAVHGFLFTSYAPVRTGHLAKERPIPWSLSFYLYSWLSGLVQLLFPLFMVLGDHGFRVVDAFFWFTLLE